MKKGDLVVLVGWVVLLFAFLLFVVVAEPLARGRDWWDIDMPRWLGGPTPFPINVSCDPFGSAGCVHASATMTAQAVPPPAWWPWGQ